MPTETISEKLLKINQIKADLKTQIEAKGVTVGNADFVDYPGLVEDIPSGSSATLITKSITENGTYNASSDNADGFSSVTVTVPTPANKFKSLVDGSITSVAADDLTGITLIKNSAFSVCYSLQSCVIPNGVLTIEDDAFLYCTALVNCSIPDTVQTIGKRAFHQCQSLRNIIIPSSVTTVGSNAFFNCLSARYGGFVFLPTNPPILGDSTVFNSTYNCPIYVKTPDSYKAATNWVALSSRIFPLVSTVADLANIDTTIYTNACVIGADNSYKEYTYDGSQWNEVT